MTDRDDAKWTGGVLMIRETDNGELACCAMEIIWRCNLSQESEMEGGDLGNRWDSGERAAGHGLSDQGSNDVRYVQSKSVSHRDELGSAGIPIRNQILLLICVSIQAENSSPESWRPILINQLQFYPYPITKYYIYIWEEKDISESKFEKWPDIP